MSDPNPADTGTQEVLNEPELLELEREFWEADQSFHEAHYTGDILTLIDGRILDRDEAVTSIGPVPALTSLDIEDTRIRRLTDDTAVHGMRPTKEYPWLSC